MKGMNSEHFDSWPDPPGRLLDMVRKELSLGAQLTNLKVSAAGHVSAHWRHSGYLERGECGVWEARRSTTLLGVPWVSFDVP